MKPLAVDLCSGLGGWTEGLLAGGWDAIGFDVERHKYGSHQYPAQLVLQDILTLDGRQFRGKVSLIVASPPCQKYSYMAMPWRRAKALAAWYRDPAFPERIVELNALFDACVRIGGEAGCPTVIENVRGAQPWVGRSRWAYGSYHIFGDVPALMPITTRQTDMKVGELNWREYGQPGYRGDQLQDRATKNSGGSWFNVAHNTESGTNNNPARGDAVKIGGGWFHDSTEHSLRRHSSKSSARKAASARIAKIPPALARWIARAYYPRKVATA